MTIGWFVACIVWSGSEEIVALITLCVDCLDGAAGVSTVVAVKSIDVRRCTSNCPGSWGRSNGIEFSISLYLSFDMTNDKYPNCPPIEVVGTLYAFLMTYCCNNKMESSVDSPSTAGQCSMC